MLPSATGIRISLSYCRIYEPPTRASGEGDGINMMGSFAAEAKWLRDETGMMGVYFVFNDLSIRTSGNYRLRFSLFDVKR
jgi:Velvet factor